MHNRSCGLCRVLCKGKTSSGVYGNIYANIYIYMCVPGFYYERHIIPHPQKEEGEGGTETAAGLAMQQTA